jgi:hypothetical protein
VGHKPNAETALVTLLKSLEAKELFPKQWVVKNERDAEDLRDRLKVLIDMDRDGLAVIAITDDAAFRKPNFDPFKM